MTLGPEYPELVDEAPEELRRKIARQEEQIEAYRREYALLLRAFTEFRSRVGETLKRVAAQ